MDYNKIETLLLQTQHGNLNSKEQLLQEFTPFIQNFTNKIYIHGYTKEDLQNECYLTLLNCINKYNPETHRFVGYATTAMKNSIHCILRKNLKHKSILGEDSLTFTGNLENLNIKAKEQIDSKIINQHTIKTILGIIPTLTIEQQEILAYVFLRHNTLTSYSQIKEIPYSTAAKRKLKLSKLLIKKFSDN